MEFRPLFPAAGQRLLLFINFLIFFSPVFSLRRPHTVALVSCMCGLGVVLVCDCVCTDRGLWKSNPEPSCLSSFAVGLSRFFPLSSASLGRLFFFSFLTSQMR